MKRFQDDQVDVAGRFSLGTDTQTGSRYLSIPVANRLVDYEEFYALSTTIYQDFLGDRKLALEFANECRERLHDDLLILKPGSDRGSAV